MPLRLFAFSSAAKFGWFIKIATAPMAVKINKVTQYFAMIFHKLMDIVFFICIGGFDWYATVEIFANIFLLYRHKKIAASLDGF